MTDITASDLSSHRASSQYDELLQHLTTVQADPSTPLDQRLIYAVSLIVPHSVNDQKLQTVLQSIAKTLDTLQQDPAPLTNLLEKLLDGDPFSNILAFEPPLNFVSGLSLDAHMLPINKLMLYLLLKVKSSDDVATVASWPDVVTALVHLWLCTPDTGVAATAGQLIVSLLKVDGVPTFDDLPNDIRNKGSMWKRLFTDKDVYGTIYQDCDLKTSKSGKNQTTLAQARLLEVLPKIAAMDWNAVTTSQHPDIEAAHGSEGGLLTFAALKMVDYKDDVLTHCVLIDFYTALINREQMSPATSLQLNFLIDNKIHDRVAGTYLQSASDADPVDAMFLYGPAANYLSVYVSRYSQHYMISHLPKSIEARLHNAFDLSASRWAHAESPKHDLHLLSSLPRKSLLPIDSSWQKSPVSLLPSRATNPDVLNTLATIFHGPVQEAIIFPPASPMVDENHEAKLEESAAARALYLNYLAHNQQFWKDITQHADTVALMDLALAAIRVLTMIITANWSTTPEYFLPSSSITTPEQGHLAILSPPALEYALPYLMKPPQTFSNLVGGRGDAESAAYKIAMAKYDALQAFHRRLAAHVEQEPGSGLGDVLATITKRLAEGPMSRAGEVGGRIATMEL